jgi:hypothetical protein
LTVLGLLHHRPSSTVYVHVNRALLTGEAFQGAYVQRPFLAIVKLFLG